MSSRPLIIYCEATSQPAEWDDKWNITMPYSEERSEAIWGVTYEEFLELTSQSSL